jgi:ornithine carbamoyltransferase
VSTGVRHFLVDTDLSAQEQAEVLDDAARRKKDRAGDPVLAGRSIALVFEKPSTRTRLSFDVGVHELGGHPLVVDAQSSQLGRGEPIEDTARVLSRYVSAIVIRTFGQDRITALAAAADVPVINALTDSFHPCQVLADLQTVRERLGGTSGVTLAYIGDGSNNMAHSLLLGGATAGLHVRIAAPTAYAPDPDVFALAAGIAATTGGSVATTPHALEAADGADVLYTDVFTSMGQEAEQQARHRAFEGFRIDTRVVDASAPGSIVLHCLPAHRGEEIAADVIDGPRSAVWDQAENRLHAQKALMAFLVGPAS